MSIKVSKSSDLSRAFVLGVDDVKQLSELLSSRDETCQFTISCKDGLSREYPTVKELLDFENPPRKEIQTLEITARSKDPNDFHFIRLNFNNRDRSNISIYLAGPEEVVSKLSDRLEDFFPRLTPWYNLVTTFHLGNFSFFTIFLLLSILISLVLTSKVMQFEARTNMESLEKVLFGAIAPLSLIAVSYMLGFIRARFFPVGVFAIGQGIARDKTKETIRKYVVGTVMASILAMFSYLFQLLYTMLSS